MNNILKRYKGNPILEPIFENSWEARMVYNCAALYEGGKVHLVYRARGVDGGVSRLGYASSKDGLHIDERLPEPIFTGNSSSDFECFGCEDPRLTRIEDRIYMCYTAFGQVPGISRRVNSIQLGMTSISLRDFLNKRWNWEKPWYPFFRVDNKDAFLFPERIKGKYVLYHRIPPHMWISYSNDLKNWDEAKILMKIRSGWENFKIGGGAPPIKTKKGWLIVYHGVNEKFHYQLGLAMASLDDPSKIIYRYEKPFLSPTESYEKEGLVPNVVFTCGAVVIKDTLFVYYGGADSVICVATANMKELLNKIKI
ncbi:MAG: glycosidase [bacterium]|nr:glycosidase [bacterium]